MDVRWRETEVSGWLAWRTKAGSAATAGISVAAAACTLPEDTLDNCKLGKSVGGRESSPVATLADPEVCQKSSVNSARKAIFRCCLADQGGVPCAMAATRGLSNVRRRKRKSSSRKRKWRTVVSQRECGIGSRMGRRRRVPSSQPRKWRCLWAAKRKISDFHGTVLLVAVRTVRIHRDLTQNISRKPDTSDTLKVSERDFI
jgi:hypothetical protein